MREDAEEALAEDLLWGAGAIARELFGKATTENKRRVYHLHETGQLPTWRHESSDEKKKGPLLARRSVLRRTFAGPHKRDEITAA
jgi:hypothetical protein